MFLVFGFINKDNNPYYIYYTQNFKEEWQKQSEIVSKQQNHEPQYEYARKLQKEGVPFIIEVLESDILTEKEAIKRVFFWIEKYRKQGVCLFNKYFDKDGNELENSPHKEKISKEKKEIMDFLWLPVNQHKLKPKKKWTRSEETKLKDSKNKKGAKNPKAKKYIFIDPNGKQYMVTGRFNAFCEEHGLRVETMRAKLKDKKKKGGKGWKVRYYKWKGYKKSCKNEKN